MGRQRKGLTGEGSEAERGENREVEPEKEDGEHRGQTGGEGVGKGSH